jgi:hypothetical protein
VEDVQDEYQLESVLHQHNIASGLFLPFTVVRLTRGPGATDAVVRVTLRNIRGQEEDHRRLRLRWSAASVPDQPMGVQENIVTEWAALGLACAVVDLYAGLRIMEVARQGESVDYWVIDGEREFGLEVSGTMAEDVAARHREKGRQLRRNPYGLDGFVVVASLSRCEVLFSYHRFTGDDP